MDSPGISASRIMTEHVAETLRIEIREAGESEVFAILSKSNPSTLFDLVNIACRGTKVEVPALLSRTHPGEMTLHNHPSGQLTPSQADLRMASLFGEEGIGSMIVDNQVLKAYVIVEPYVAAKLEPVSEEEIIDIFKEEGRLSGALDGYETREGQREMAQRISESFHKGSITAIEAGTGTGKSLAYLVPALLWSKINRKRVLIATKTIALQEQLLYKDIPIAKKVVKDAPETALIKGRSNYVCKRKLQDIELDQMEFEFGEETKSLKSELQAISDWVHQHPSGDRSELPFQPTQDAWEAVQSDSDMCLGSSCPFYQESPFYQSRRQAAKAGVLIVNQALLFTDLALRMTTGNYKASAIIPPYFTIILDEAHSIEDVATDHFGSRISSFGIRKTLGKFISSKNNKGLLDKLHKRAMRYLAMDFAKSLEENVVHIQSLRDSFLFKLGEFTDLLHESFNTSRYKKLQVHLDQSVLHSDKLNPLRIEAEELASLNLQLSAMLKSVLDTGVDALAHKAEDMESFFIEFRARLTRFSDLAGTFKRFASKEIEEQVQWLTLIVWKGRRSEFHYQVSPIDVSSLLVKALFDPFHSVIATSATLNLKDEFDFYRTRSGMAQIEKKTVEFFDFPSPFPLSRLASFVIPDYIPLPTHPDYPQYIKDCILSLAKAGNGGTLVLFTSYALLYKMASLCETDLSKMGVELLVQGRDPRPTLVQRLTSTHGVLFGTDTFWEGIDLRGESLTKVLISKLPFRQLGDPVFEARSKKIKDAGGNDFKDFALPLALLKFKQGVGRLVRSHTDRGIVVVTDPRITRKYYGKKFFAMASELPKVNVPDHTEFEELLDHFSL